MFNSTRLGQVNILFNNRNIIAGGVGMRLDVIFGQALPFLDTIQVY